MELHIWSLFMKNINNESIPQGFHLPTLDLYDGKSKHLEARYHVQLLNDAL